MKASLIIFGLAALVFSSCATSINGPLNADGSASLTINASLEPRTAALIRNLSAAAGTAQGNVILDGPLIAQSMTAAPGMASVSFRNTSPAAITGETHISQIGEFLGGAQDFITFEQGASGGRCVITISRETGPGILSLLSPQITEYLAALMAPLATGEVLSIDEYLFMVSTVYNRAIADEISRSRIQASITFPGPIQSVRGGTFSGRRAYFDIPLVDLLVLETPLSYEVVWN